MKVRVQSSFIDCDAPETAKRANHLRMRAKKRTEELLKNARKIEGSFDVGDHADKYDRCI